MSTAAWPGICSRGGAAAGGRGAGRASGTPSSGSTSIYDSIFGAPADGSLAAAVETFGRLGPTYTVKRWSWEVIYTADGCNIKHLLAGAGFGDFALPRLRVAAMGALLGRGIFTLDGPAWARARAVLKPLLARLDRQAVAAALEPHFQTMLAAVAEPDAAGRVDLQLHFFRLAMDFAGHHLAGSPAPGAAAADRVRVERFVDDYMACSREVVRKMRLGPLQHLRFSPSAYCAKRRVFRYVDDFIADALTRSGDGEGGAAGAGSGSIPSELAAATRDRKALRDQVLHLLVASRDTTLPRGGGADGCAPLLVPRGVVMYNTYALHRDEAVFGARPDAFEPERWRGLRPGWGYLPFSGGPRICMGQQLALTQVQYVAARMAQTFEAIESHEAREWVELDALAATCRGGVLVSLRRAPSREAPCVPYTT